MKIKCDKCGNKISINKSIAGQVLVSNPTEKQKEARIKQAALMREKRWVKKNESI